VRELSELVNSGIQPLQNLSLRKALDRAGIPPAPFVGELIEKGLRALEARAEATAGRFLVGDALTFADVYLVPQLYTAERFGVDPSPFPTLSRVERACAPRPAIQGAHARSQPAYERGG
jgi:maleylpyruvate isomerase